jgi:uncharacterized membrane protein YccC
MVHQMRMPLKWNWPRDSSLGYCFKAGLAALLGYLLSVGGPWYSVYGVFSAALIVGASRGEDTVDAARRVRGSLAGMLMGVALTQLGLPPAVSVALGIGGTAYICMGCGWGIAAARIGSSLCAVTLLMHATDPMGYASMRGLNTLIGIASGMLVSYVVLSVRGRDVMARSAKHALQAVSELLDSLARTEQPSERSQYRAVLDNMVECEKALMDARNEIHGESQGLRSVAREIALACVGALSAALAHSELRRCPAGLEESAQLLRDAQALARRAQSAALDAQCAVVAEQAKCEDPPTGLDTAAMQALSLALRKVEHALRALGH